MSDTPRTDEAIMLSMSCGFWDGYEAKRDPVVEEAKKLERDLAAERERREKAETMVAWYAGRFLILQREQKRMRDPERTLLCDILANGALLPDPNAESEVSE